MQLNDPLLNLATVLLAGIVGGEVLGRLRLPKVTGWIGTGILVRTFDLPGLGAAGLPRFSPFTDFVLGFIAFTVGATLHFASLRNAEKRLSLLLLGEAVVTPLVVVCALYFVGGMFLGPALLLGAIAIAGAPGTTVLVIREARARGILARTLIAAIGLIDMVAVGMFVGAMALLHEGGDPTIHNALQAVGSEFGVALLVGGGGALVVLALTRTLVGPAFVGPIMVALIMVAWGGARAVGVSSILACTFAGIVVTNVRRSTATAAEAYLHPFGGVLFAGFYTLAGMRLDFGLVLPVLGLVTLFFLARLVGKSLGAYLAMAASGAPKDIRRYLGPALLPHGGVAVGLIFLVQDTPALAGFQDLVATVGLAALAINQLLGPSATRFALQQAGEVGKDRPRLLDFIREPNIVTGLRGQSREDVIRTLADRLYTTVKLPLDKDEFVQRVLERESEASTCMGEGLMIPHCSLPEGSAVTGVLGLSSEGLNLGAPDGRDVHAVMLLATPDADRQRHLEILAAFATAITRDQNLREQLYHARNAAHAYAVIHAEDSEDLNYFLDDAIQHANEDG